MLGGERIRVVAEDLDADVIRAGISMLWVAPVGGCGNRADALPGSVARDRIA